jgi:ABC-type transporter Mla maintaining outer membrane lipid asymmetry ATPase subunit MlaF
LLEKIRDSDESKRTSLSTIIGLSGTGKSVTLEHIIRLLKPDTG